MQARQRSAATPGRVVGRLDPRAVLRRRKDRPRRYLRPGIDLEHFFDELNRRGVRYAVLRWFDTLPTVEPGEDIDFLVADEDLDALRPFLRSYVVPPGTQKFDVYTVSGLPGSDYRTIPYFTPALATRLLERSVLLGGRFRAPDTQDHFDSLAYHAVYHKGRASGLPADAASDPPAEPGEHDYAEVLGELADELDLSVSITLDGLDSYLADKGLRPPLDTLDKLADTNTWLSGRLEKLWGPTDAGMPGLAVFVLRERAGHLVDELQAELLREGFEPLEVIPLTGADAQRVTEGVRGGNWGRGPYAVAGGPPVAYVVAYDLTRSTGTATLPSDPARVLDAKVAIRGRLLNRLAPGEPRFNPLHSSDDPRQALDYLAALDDPGIAGRMQRRIAAIRSTMTFPYPLVEVLPSLQRRAVTAVVRHPEHGECVCKLFYPSSERFLARELRARTEFGDLPEAPGLLESGPNYLLTPRYTDTRAHVRRRLPGIRDVQLTPRASATMARLARDLHERDVFLLDLSTQNLLTDPVHGLKVLDWEFLQDFAGEKPPLRRSPSVLGRAAGAEVDLPLGVSASAARPTRSGEPPLRGTLFRPLFTGVPTALLLRAPAPVFAPLAEVGMLAIAAVRSVVRAGGLVARSGRDRARVTAKRTLVRVTRAGGSG
jgi:hypothetical protein